MKKILIPFLLLVFIFSFADEASAQRRGKKKRTRTEDSQEEDTSSKRSREDDEITPNFKESLNTEIKLGNINFFNNVFNLSMKSNVGYKFNKTFSAGLGAKFEYYYLNNIVSDDFSDFSYGALGYARAKITSQFYAQVEYNAYRATPRVVAIAPKETFLYPSAGIGYMYEGFNWSSGFELLVPLDGDARDNFGIVEYWFSFSHNF